MRLADQRPLDNAVNVPSVFQGRRPGRPSRPAVNILLVNHYAGGDTLGMEYRPNLMARQWARRGHRVTVVAGSYSHLRRSQPSVVASGQEDVVDGVPYLWIRTPRYTCNGLRRAMSMFCFVAGVLRLRAVLSAKADSGVVIASSTYPLDAFCCDRIASKASASRVYEVHDLWPLSPMELGGMSRWHPFVLVMQAAENFAYRRSQLVVSMLPKALPHMCQHGMDPDKFLYVPNGVSEDEWQTLATPLPEVHRQSLEALHTQRRFVIGYAGAHGLANALATLLETAELLREEGIAFTLVGEGPEKEALQSKARQSGLSNLLFLPAVPRGCIPALLARFDACYIGLKRSSIFRFGVSPNKLLDYMMAGRPVIQAIDAGNDLVCESGCGMTTAPEEPAALANAVRALQAMSTDRREIMGGRGREYVKTHHSYGVLSDRFLTGMQRLAARKETHRDSL